MQKQSHVPKSSLRSIYNLYPIQPPETFGINIKCIASNSTAVETTKTTDHIKQIFSPQLTDCFICIIKYRKNNKDIKYDAVPNILNITLEKARPNVPDLVGKTKT